MSKFCDIEKYINTVLSQERLGHVYSVRDTAGEMCRLLGRGDLCEAAETAGLLHDITKELDRSEHLKIIRDSGLILNEEDMLSPKILHAFTGAVKARELFPDIVNDEIYGAIFNHTTGDANMSFLEKVIFLADYIEPTRKYSDCQALYRYFTQRITDGDILDTACLISLSNTIAHLTKKGEHVNSRTLRARDSLLNKEKK